MSRLLPCTLLTLFVAFASSLAQQANDDSNILSFSPRLTVEAVISDLIASLPPKAPEELRSYRGMVIEKNAVEEIYPLLPTVFFETAQDTLPVRYKLFRTPEQRMTFTDTTMPGGTIQKYWYTVNIIGYRMEKFPQTTIRLAGSYSLEQGENRLLAGKRVMFVKNYLTNIWGISPARIDLGPVHEPSGANASVLSDTMRQAELRHVNIESDFNEILAPIEIREYRRFISPDKLYFHIDPILPAEQIARYTIEILQGNKLLDAPWPHDSTVLTEPLDIYDIFFGEDFAELNGITSLQFTVTITDKNGMKSRSNPAFVPVKTVTIPVASRRTCSLNNRTINRYSLLIFPYGCSELNSQHKRLIATKIAPNVRDGARIKITGYCDLSEHDATKQLSTERGKGVSRQLLSVIDTNRIRSIGHEGVGSTQPLFANDLPEGRCYNRTVQILIQAPREQREWWE